MRMQPVLIPALTAAFLCSKPAHSAPTAGPQSAHAEATRTAAVSTAKAGAAGVSAADSKVSAEEIVGKVEAKLAPKNIAASYKFTNTRTDGSTSEYEVSFEIRDASQSRGIFKKPEREKGREVLRTGDAIWTFLPSVGRVLRILDRDSFAGGDFSNADVLRADWLAHYEAALLKELPKQWIIELSAKGTDAAYAKMRLWVDKESVQPVQQKFYDSQGTHLKTCTYGEAKNFGTITRPAKLRMENVITKQRSELEVLSFKEAGSLPDNRFLPDNLGK